MDFFKICRNYFNAGHYTAEQLNVFVVKGKITPEEYQQITGIPYIA